MPTPSPAPPKQPPVNSLVTSATGPHCDDCARVDRARRAVITVGQSHLCVPCTLLRISLVQAARRPLVYPN